MSTSYFRAVRLEGGDAEAGQAAPLKITAATAGRKSDGIDLADLPWDMRRGKPVDGGRARFPLLWAHDLSGTRPPLGWAYVGIGDDGTTLDDTYIVFDPADAEAVAIERKYRSEHGGLDSFSITWDVVDADGLSARVSGKKPAANQLLEVSGVPVPLDAGATVRAQRSAYADLGRRLLDLAAPEDVTGLTSSDLDTGTTDADDAAGEDVADRTAADMVALFDPASCDPDDDARRREYRALAARYTRLGWTAPEFVPLAELRALDLENWRAIWLNGEVDMSGQRVSMVLAARNRDRVVQARDLLSDVLTDADAASKGKAETPRDLSAIVTALGARDMAEAVAKLQEVMDYLQGEMDGGEGDAPAEDVPAEASADGEDAEARAFAAEVNRLLDALA